MAAPPIAIVGMAGIFPQAATIAQFWDNIVSKRNCITEVPPSRWRLEDYYDPDPSAPDKTYSRWGGFIPDVEFDPIEFGIPPNTLEVTDVAQLLGLLVAKRALDDAGYGETSERPFDRRRTGIVLGVGGGQKLITPLTTRLQSPVWEEAMRSSGLSTEDAGAIAQKIKRAYVGWEENSFPGMLGNVIAGRIANRLDLGGINCVVDAACASSLAALRMALCELADGQADIMITGGVDADNSIFMYMCFSKTPAFTAKDRISPFDASSDGMLIGEGIGMAVLKRLEDAQRDGDRIYAVVKGLGSSSDGRFKSIYAPRSEGQAEAVQRAYNNAGVSLDSVGLIEAHGTGTIAGDLVEVSTLQRLFGNGTARLNQVALGSVKSQIGHTKASAGAAGLLKAALALHHKVLPPTINITQPHPAGDFGNSPLYLNTETRPWLRLDANTPRRAGVSSFGFGGTNYHVVLEEYEAEMQQAYRLHHVTRPFVLSSATATDLATLCRQQAQLLDSGEAEAAFARLSSKSSRPDLRSSDARVGFVASHPGEARDLLLLAAESLEREPEREAWEHPRGIFFRSASTETEGHVAVLFPGQGSQYVDMGRELSTNFPEIRESFSAAGQEVAEVPSLVYPPPAFDEATNESQAQRLRQTEFAQPAIGALSAGMFALLLGSGLEPNFVAGHSFGELTALWAAGAFSRGDFLHLAAARGRAMAPPDDPNFDPGAMLSVPAGEDDLLELLPRLDGVVIANVNAPRQLVLAGPTLAIEQAERLLADHGLDYTRLPVSAAFHSSLVAHGQATFQRELDAVSITPPAIEVYSNATGRAYPHEPAAMAELLGEQMLRPVQFAAMVENMYAAGARLFVEVGPRSVLTNLVGDILGEREHLAVAVNPSRGADSDRQFRSALVRLVVAGVPLNLEDAYIRELPAATHKPSPATVTLNGANYVSPRTRQDYEQALNNGHRVTAAVPQTQEHDHPVSAKAGPSKAVHEATPVAPLGEEVPASGQPGRPPVDDALPAHELAQLDTVMVNVAGQQSAAATLHLQFLADQAALTKHFLELLGRQQDLLRLPSASDIPAAAHESLAAGLGMFHKVQAETAQAHQQYFQYQTEFLRLLAARSEGERLPSFPAVEPQPLTVREPNRPERAATEEAFKLPSNLAPPPAGSAAVDVTAALLAVVSDKTGYPPNTLELDMDIEADLGIDSIKRVEILGAMRERFQDAPALKPTELAELRTLAQIVAYLQQHASAPPGAVQPVVSEQPARPMDLAGVTGQLLAVVSDKTGYPVNTLDLDMDIEADLGIDSIKRVEILGAMRERFPDAPALKPTELAELRTLAQIVSYLSQLGGPAANDVSAPPAAVTIPAPVAYVSTYGVRLKRLPSPDRLELPPNGGRCLVVADGTPLTAAICSSLAQAGWSIVVVVLPSAIVAAPSGLPESFERLDLEQLGDEYLGTRLRSLGSPETQGIVYLHPRSAASEEMFAEGERQAVKGLFFLAKHLQAPLAEASRSQQGRPFFIAVTRLDGSFGVGLDGDEQPGHSAIAGGVFGLVKTLRLEWPDVHCRAIDISPTCSPDIAAAHIVSEILDPDGFVAEVGFGSQGRVTLVPLEPLGGADMLGR